MQPSELNAREYEELTRSVYDAMLKAEGVTSIEVLHDQEVQGKSGAKHQIDVLWRFTQAGVDFTILVECKNFASKLEIGHVRNFLSVVQDIVNARGIMVTKVGYQKGASVFAKHHGIGLKVLRRPTESDWKGRVRNINVNVHIKRLWNDRDHPLSITPHWVLRDKDQAVRLQTAKQTDQRWFNETLNSSGDVSIADSKAWVVQQIPVLQKTHGGPHEHTIDLKDSFFRVPLTDGTTELVQASKLDVSYYVSSTEEKIFVWGDELVRYILRDFLSGKVEYVLRKQIVTY